MVLSRLTKITGPGVSTDTNWVGNNADFTGITTSATSFNIGVTTIHSNLIEAHNIKSTGIITATGAHFSGNVSVAGTFTYEDVTNVDSVGFITARSQLNVGNNIKLGNAGVITATSFVGDGSGLIGVASTDNIVTGTAATFTGGVDINSDLDVDGHTNLDNVNVAGVSTFAGTVNTASIVATGIDLNGDIDVDGHTNLDNVSIAGVTTITSAAPELHLTDTNANSDYSIVVNGGQFRIRDETNSANRLAVNSDGHVDVYGRLDAIGGLFASADATIEGDLTLTDTTADSAAGPEFKLFRNSASPADADYLGQIKFAGESDTGVERNYAKITGKILDASNTTEDGIIEIAHIKAGSQTITGRWRSDSLQLLNSTNFSVAGTAEVTGTATFTGNILPSSDSATDIGTNSVRFRNLYADTLYGDGSNLTGISGVTINNNANNRVITGSGSANTLEGEANLTFTGSILTVTNSSGASELTLVTPSANDSGVYFNDGSNAGALSYNHSDNSMRFRVNSTEKLRITSGGQVLIGTSSGSEQLVVKRNDAVGPTITLENDSNLAYINNWGSSGGGSGRTNRFEINATTQGQASFCAQYHTFMAGGVGDSNEKVRITSDELRNSTQFYSNKTAIASNKTITTSYNHMTIGNMTINSGVTVTVNSGARWVIV